MLSRSVNCSQDVPLKLDLLCRYAILGEISTRWETPKAAWLWVVVFWLVGIVINLHVSIHITIYIYTYTYKSIHITDTVDIPYTYGAGVKPPWFGKGGCLLVLNNFKLRPAILGLKAILLYHILGDEVMTCDLSDNDMGRHLGRKQLRPLLREAGLLVLRFESDGSLRDGFDWNLDTPNFHGLSSFDQTTKFTCLWVYLILGHFHTSGEIGIESPRCPETHVISGE